MARLETKEPIIPQAEAVKEFEQHGLTEKKCWVCNTRDKNPVNPLNLFRAGSTDPETWGTYKQALKGLGKTATISDGKDENGKWINHYDLIVGLGIVLQRKYRLCCIDLDACVEDGIITDQESLEIIQRMGSYTEISGSGSGIHIFFFADCPEDYRVNIKMPNGRERELYCDKHFIMLTGNTLPGYDRISERQTELQEVYHKYYEPYADTERKTATKKNSGRAANTAEKKTPEINAIENHDWKFFRKKFKQPERVFSNPGEFFEELFRFPLDEFLGLPYGKKIRCLFHSPDNNPSATIYRTEKGKYVFHCFSEDLTVNILHCVEYIGRFQTKTEAIDFVKLALNYSIKEDEWSIRQKAEIQHILDLLLSVDEESFQNLCPSAYSNLSRGCGLRNLQILMLYIRDHVAPIPRNQDASVYFSITIDRITDLIRQTTGTGSHSKTHRWIHSYIEHKIIQPVKDDEIPKDLLEKSKDKANPYKKHTAFYKVQPWVFQQLRAIEIAGRNYKTLRRTLKGLSYQTAFETEGQESADKKYTQGSSLKNSKLAKERKQRFIDIVNDLLDKKHYITDKIVCEEYAARFPGEPKEAGRTAWLRVREAIILEQDLRVLQTNREIKAQYGLTCKNYPKIWIGVN